MDLHGAFRDRQSLGDRLVAQPLGDHLEDVDLARCQRSTCGLDRQVAVARRPDGTGQRLALDPLLAAVHRAHAFEQHIGRRFLQDQPHRAELDRFDDFLVADCRRQQHDSRRQMPGRQRPEHVEATLPGHAQIAQLHKLFYEHQ